MSSSRTAVGRPCHDLLLGPSCFHGHGQPRTRTVPGQSRAMAAITFTAKGRKAGVACTTDGVPPQRLLGQTLSAARRGRFRGNVAHVSAGAVVTSDTLCSGRCVCRCNYMAKAGAEGLSAAAENLTQRDTSISSLPDRRNLCIWLSNGCNAAIHLPYIASHLFG